MFQDALDEIREAIPKTTPQQQKVGIYFCEHPETLGVLSLSDFALKIGTSGPTVNRFCRTLGYNGFLDFSRAMQTIRNNEISHAAYFHNARIRNARTSERGRMARMLLEKEVANIQRLAENYPAEKIASCVALMKQSSSINIIGKMSAYPAAVYFEQLLSKITPKLVPMSGSDVMQAAAISRIDKNSVVFCIAFPRYPRAVVEMSREISQKGAAMIAITDDKQSPLAEICNLLFTVDVEIFSYIDLFGPVFAIINTICLEFSLEQSAPSEKSLVKYDKVVANSFLISGRKNSLKKDMDS